MMTKVNERRNEHIILVGFMGTGKTTIGRALAEKVGLQQVDLDQYIVKQLGCSIAELFSEKGEDFFRDVESTFLRELLNGNKQVITTGGGAVLRPENVAAMLEGGVVVALQASEEELIRRLSSDLTRPLLAGGVSERVKSLLEERAGAYDFAPIQVDTTGKRVSDIVAEIIARMVEINPFRRD